MSAAPTIEAVRGSLTSGRADQVLQLWATHGALTGDAARAQLDRVVCVVVDGREVVGACSAFEADVPLLGDRRFWMHQRFLAQSVPLDVEEALLAHAYDVLAAERASSDAGPLGVCFLLEDGELRRRGVEAVWPVSGFVYAGYSADGRQARIRYFPDTTIS